MGWVEGVKMGTEWYNDRIAKERQDRIEAQNKQLFDAKMEEIDRAKREREALAQAAASVTPNVSNPTLDTSANAVPDPEIAKNVPTQYSVNGVQQADMPSMQNTVRDMTARKQAEVLNRLGNPMAALNLINAADESKLNGFKLANAEREQADDKFNRHIDEIIARSPDKWTGLAAIGTETQVGPMKDVKVRVQSDGTNMRFVSTLPDGTERPGSTYTNTDEGFMKARADLMRLDPATKSKILDEQVKTKRDQSNKDRDFTLREMEAKSRAELRSAQAENASMRNQIAMQRMGGGGQGGQPGQVAQVSLKDQREHSDDVLKRLGKPADFATQAEADAWQAKHFDELSTNAAFFKLNASYGTVLTGDETMKAYRLSQDPKNVKTIRDTETGEYFKAVNVNGTLVRTNRASPPGAQSDAPNPPSDQTGAKPPGVNMQNTVSPSLTSKNTKVLSEAAPIKPMLGMLGMGKPDPAYNIQLPDGTTKVVPVSELEKMGFPINRVAGKTFYDPTYR